MASGNTDQGADIGTGPLGMVTPPAKKKVTKHKPVKRPVRKAAKKTAKRKPAGRKKRR